MLRYQVAALSAVSEEIKETLPDNLLDMKQECENCSMCIENSEAKDIVIKTSDIRHLVLNNHNA